ncbi:MAG TPA: hypothetical protein VMR70_16090 [Flavisolibacter sp.]|nr:hypothetical protein [Flavisolibacter sp.]
MATEFQQTGFNEQPLQCGKCGWQGTGHDAVVIDFYGVSKNKEVHCPDCDERLGLVRNGGGPPGESATELSFQTG